MPRTPHSTGSVPGLRLVLAPGADRAELEALLMLSPGALRHRPGVSVVRDRDQTRVLRIERPGPPALYWKEFGPRDALDTFKEFWRPSKASRAWTGAERLRELGIGTAPLVARAEAPRRGPFRHRRSLLVTEEIPDAVGLDEYLGRFPPDPSARTRREKRELLRTLGRVAARLHEGGCYHGDLRPGNILCRIGDGTPEIFLIDTDRILPRRLPGLREAARNLMQINFLFAPSFTLTDRLRLLHAYGRERNLDAATRRRLVTLYRRTVRRLRRIRRPERGRRAPSPDVAAQMQQFLSQLQARRTQVLHHSPLR